MPLPLLFCGYRPVPRAHLPKKKHTLGSRNINLFDAGVFSAPKAKAYWRRALLVTMINAREKAVAEGLAKAEALENQ